MRFDARKSHSEDEYIAFIEWLSDSCVRDMKQITLPLAIEQYIRRGYEAHLSPSELTDYFCVSSNNVVETAGFTSEEADVVVRVYDDLHERIWPGYRHENEKA